MGLNPECKDFTGEMLNDEGVNGTIHIGVGTSANLGGDVQAQDPLRRHHQGTIGLVRRRAHHPGRRDTAGRGMMGKVSLIRL